MLEQPRFPPERLPAGQRFHFRPIVHHPLEPDQSVRTQHPQHLREQLVQRRLMLHAEVRQGVMIHRLQTRQPLIGRMIFAAPLDLARRTHTLAVGVNPQTDQQLRIESRPPRFTFHRLDRRAEPAQVQPPHQLPNCSRRVVGFNQLLHIHRPQHHLPAIHPLDTPFPLLPVTRGRRRARRCLLRLPYFLLTFLALARHRVPSASKSPSDALSRALRSECACPSPPTPPPRPSQSPTPAPKARDRSDNTAGSSPPAGSPAS